MNVWLYINPIVFGGLSGFLFSRLLREQMSVEALLLFVAWLLYISKP